MVDALRAVAGFPLTNNNYDQVVNLLEEQFGQPTKTVNAHMWALLDLTTPSYHLSSLQTFHDTLENHVQGLDALGRSHETYGDLLIPVILGKLPLDMCTNLPRDHDGHKWTFPQLRDSILEVGTHTPFSKGTLLGTFLTQAQGKPLPTPQFRPPKTRKRCTYCKGPHPSYNCNLITSCQ